MKYGGHNWWTLIMGDPIEALTLAALHCVRVISSYENKHYPSIFSIILQ